jgi:hypothetical protein
VDEVAYTCFQALKTHFQTHNPEGVRICCCVVKNNRLDHAHAEHASADCDDSGITPDQDAAGEGARKASKDGKQARRGKHGLLQPHAVDPTATLSTAEALRSRTVGQAEGECRHARERGPLLCRPL